MTKQELNSLKTRYDIIGDSPDLNRALEIAMTVAPTDLTVLVTGESGVGKENIPAIIHRNSRRKNGKYFAVNCGAIPEGTIDSELFGHEKGSFTGAVEMRKGYFEEADGGTLFLDEIGELPLSSQAKLLRVLQSGEFIRVGSSKVLRTDVRVVAATNVNLMHAVSRGKFREDLYYRLNAVPIRMPALRDRKDDIHLLFRKFVADFSDKYSMAPIRLTDDAVALLRTYRWPGNIRQLKNVAEAVSVMESTRMTPGSGRIEIDAAVLSKYIPREEPNRLPAVLPTESDSLNREEREAIIKALFQLKQDVDSLKAAVFGEGARGAQQHGTSLPQWEEQLDPDEQVFDDTAAAQAQEGKPYVNAQAQESIPHANAQAQEGKPGDMAQAPLPDADEDTLVAPIPELNANMIRRALQMYPNRKEAAKALGMTERTFYRKKKEFGL